MNAKSIIPITLIAIAGIMWVFGGLTDGMFLAAVALGTYATAGALQDS